MTETTMHKWSQINWVAMTTEIMEMKLQVSKEKEKPIMISCERRGQSIFANVYLTVPFSKE